MAKAATDPDRDLEAMSCHELIGEIKRLRAGIREHRDASGHDLCWHHPELWSLLPEQTDPLPDVPPWPDFLAGCIKYRRSLDVALSDRMRDVGAYRGEKADRADETKTSKR